MLNSFYEIKNVKSRFLSGKKIYKIIFFCLLTSVLCPPSSFSQTAPGIEWQKCFGGSSYEDAVCIQQTSDGGYIVAGSTHSNDSDVTGNHGENDFWIVKTDSIGNLMWQKCLGGTGNEFSYYVQQTTDGGYISTGWTQSNDGDVTGNFSGGTVIWVVKLYSNGNLQWQKCLGSHNGWSIQQTIDGGYIVGGSGVNPGVSTDFKIVKIDSIGNLQWQQLLGGSQDDYGISVQQTSDKGYIVSGSTLSNDGDVTGNHDPTGYYDDVWIVKTDSMGNLQWQKCFGGTDYDQSCSIRQTTDGGYITAGLSRSNDGDVTGNNGSDDYWIVKMDSSGNLQWENSLGGLSGEQAYSIEQTADGGYIATGITYSNSGDVSGNHGSFDYWVTKLQSNGNLQWQKCLGGTGYDWSSFVQQTSDGGYIVTGKSGSLNGDVTGNHGGSDIWIVKLYPDTITGIANFHPDQIGTNFQINPNPLISQSKLTFKNLNKEKFLFTLYDITGRITESVSTTYNEIILTKGSKQQGVYLFNLLNEKTEERMNGKIMVSD